MSLATALLLAALPFGLGSGTNALAKGESISVAARRCDMDRKEGVVLFDGRVRVDYEPGYTLFADRVFALFSGTNELERLVAVGHVAITNEARVGACDRAVFWRKTGEIEMTGEEGGELARLADGSANAMAGRKMKFWLKKEQVEITGAELFVSKDGRSVKDL